MAWVRVLLVLATTLASSRFHNHGDGSADTEEGQCLSAGVFTSCSTLDKRVEPPHVVLPLCASAAVVLVEHAPTLLLKSRVRISGLWSATWRLLMVLVALLACSSAFTRASRAWSYALSLHFSALYICQERCPTILLGEPAHRAIQAVSLLLLIVGAWRIGPPLPAWDAPGIPGCCGAVAHMAAWAAAETLGRAGVGLLKRRD